MYAFLCEPLIHILEKTKRKRCCTYTYPAKNLVQKENHQICPKSWRLPVLLAVASKNGNYSKKIMISETGIRFGKYKWKLILEMRF